MQYDDKTLGKDEWKFSSTVNDELKEYTLRFDIDALQFLETITDAHYQAIMQAAQSRGGALSIGDTRYLLLAGLRYKHDDIALSDVDDIIRGMEGDSPADKIRAAQDAATMGFFSAALSGKKLRAARKAAIKASEQMLASLEKDMAKLLEEPKEEREEPFGITSTEMDTQPSDTISEPSES